MVATRYTPRAGHLPYVAIALSLVVAVLAILPIVAAVIGGVGGGPRTAFASAPAGTYLVATRSDGATDTILVAGSDDPANWTEIAKVDHLPGYTPTGVVSPDGHYVALVVADAGTQARPGASLLVVELETGAVTRAAIELDPLQTAVWAPDGRVVFTRSSASDSPRTNVSFHAVGTDGSNETELGRVDGVLGAYSVGFDPQGRFVAVSIGDRGSIVLRDWLQVRTLSKQITRDWRLSPDGTSLAFIESDVTSGLRYSGGVVSLEGPEDAAMAQSADDGTQELGVAWGPAGPTFGNEPGVVATMAEGAAAQSAAAGFDVPLSYSPDGQLLVVQHWDGASFAEAGKMHFEIVRGSDRLGVDGVTQVYGWAVR